MRVLVLVLSVFLAACGGGGKKAADEPGGGLPPGEPEPASDESGMIPPEKYDEIAQRFRQKRPIQEATKMNQELREFIVSNYLFGQPADFSDDDSLQEKGIIDSTGVLELVSWLEDTYGIRIGDNELLPENLDSINRLARFLERKKLAAGSRVEAVG